MTISLDEIETIARLARLDLAATDIPNLEQDLNQILDFVQQMGGVNTAEVPALASAVEQNGHFRPDTVTEVDERKRFQAIAPATADGLYLVPKVID